MKKLIGLVLAILVFSIPAQTILQGPIPMGVGQPVVTVANNTDGTVPMLIGQTLVTMAPHTASNYIGERGALTVQISVA